MEEVGLATKASSMCPGESGLGISFRHLKATVGKWGQV